MKKLFLFLTFLLLAATVQAQDQSSTPTIESAQVHIYQIRLQLNDAQYRLNTLLLTKKRLRVATKYSELQQDPNTNPNNLKKLQDILGTIDAQMDKTKKHHDLTEQLLNAKLNNDSSAADDAEFKLKEL